jgi:hypothetical protein
VLAEKGYCSTTIRASWAGWAITSSSGYDDAVQGFMVQDTYIKMAKITGSV